MPRPFAALAIGLVAGFATLPFAVAPCSAQTKPGEIKGVDAMGDKSRSAQDGWSQAPVPREESAGKDAPNPGGKSTSENRDRPVPAANPTGSRATDPQAPLDNRAPTPSGSNPAVPGK